MIWWLLVGPLENWQAWLFVGACCALITFGFDYAFDDDVDPWS